MSQTYNDRSDISVEQKFGVEFLEAPIQYARFLIERQHRLSGHLNAAAAVQP